MTAERHHPTTRIRQQPADVIPQATGTTSAGPRPCIRTGSVVASLLNGVLGNPLLHIRLRRQRRSLFFALGDAGHLPAKIAHQLTDVFITHAHFDHIGGFPWLLRSRIGDFPALRLYGPRGLVEHIEGFVRGVLWDRAAARLAGVDRLVPFHFSRRYEQQLERLYAEIASGFTAVVRPIE